MRIRTLALALCLLATQALAASSIDATKPVTGSALSSSVIRANFAAAASDITALQASVATASANALQKSGNLSDLTSASTARTNLGLATVAASGSASDLSAGTLPTARMPAMTGGDCTTSAGAVSIACSVSSMTGTLAVAHGGTSATAASGTALDNISGFASTGAISRTAAGTYAFRTLTAPAAGLSVSNGDGVSGNPTIALANDLSAVEALSGTGLAVRTGTDSWTTRTMTGSSGVTVTNGDGVAGAPAVALNLATGNIWTAAQAVTLAATGFANTLTSQDAGAGAGPGLLLFRDSASPAASDVLGILEWDGRDSAANQQVYAYIIPVITDATSTSEDSNLFFHVEIAGVDTTVFGIKSGHIVSGGVAPSIASGAGDCGTTPAIAGNDINGRVTVGSGANGGKCTITFVAAYVHAPQCAVFDETTSNLMRPVAATGTLAITGTLVAGDSLVYRCSDYQ